MQTALVSDPAPALRGRSAPQGRDLAPRARAREFQAEADDAFVAMLGAYRSSGGLARVDDVVTLLEGCGHAGVATLARWIVERSVISFEWQQQTWLPWFQFKGADRVPDPALRAVLAELGAACDGWALADWFAWPHPALAGGAPVDLIASDPNAVLQAARVETFGSRSGERCLETS